MGKRYLVVTFLGEAPLKSRNGDHRRVGRRLGGRRFRRYPGRCDEALRVPIPGAGSRGNSCKISSAMSPVIPGTII